jgi:hypothetical protein
MSEVGDATARPLCKNRFSCAGRLSLLNRRPRRPRFLQTARRVLTVHVYSQAAQALRPARSAWAWDFYGNRRSALISAHARTWPTSVPNVRAKVLAAVATG